LIGEVNDRLAAFLQIISTKKEDTHYYCDAAPGQRAIDIWIGEAHYLGKGYETVMMQLALDKCFAAEAVQTVVIDSPEEARFAKRISANSVGGSLRSSKLVEIVDKNSSIAEKFSQDKRG